jgi:hypothetical protein
MKSWRTITAAVLVASAPATAVFAGGKCEPSISLANVFPLVMCVEREDTTSANVGNSFPWDNSTFFFSNYRNQFLFPSSTLTAVAARAVTIESMHSRAVSFTGASVNVYDSTASDNYVKVGKAIAGTLSPTFAANPGVGGGIEYMNYVGPKTVTHVVLGKAQLSDFVSRGADPTTRNDLDKIIDFRVDDPTKTHILVDQLMRLSALGNSGNGVWDVTSGACSDPKRAYGSGVFANPNALTTALGVDDFTMVWVFRGKATAPPATVQQQIAEIIRLLITPEGLRCSGLDLTVDGRLADEPLNFPSGKDYDAISPQITNGGVVTGEEVDNKPRRTGWN